MKRSWITYLIFACFAGLLVLLGGLQYRWLSQISESDGEKAHKRVQEQAGRYAEDFNREIQSAYFNFQTDAESWKNRDWNAFNERYKFWLDKTAYPELITDFYFFDTNSDAPPLRFDQASRTFGETTETANLTDLRRRFSDDKTFKPVYEDSYTLVLPIHDIGKHDIGKKVERVVLRPHVPEGGFLEKMPLKYGWLVIKLDPAVIKEKLIADLNSKYFGDGEFLTSVTDRSGEPVFQAAKMVTTDATAPLLDLSPENFIFYANKDLMEPLKREAGEKHADVILSSRVETHSFNRVQSTGDDKGTVTVEIKGDSRPRTSVFTATTDSARGNSPWTLNVQHSSGSLDGFMAASMRRNLAIGFGLLFLLAAAVAAIIFSAHRAKMLAQRQVEFVSSVSHEFRTPIAVIYSAGENLADGVAKEDGQVSRYGTLIKGEGRKLSAMVEQILDFAGANSGRRKYNFVGTAVATIIENALAECGSLIDEKGIEVETDISPVLPVIKADRYAVSQAIQNLIVNSVKYNNGDKRIHVSAENGGGTVKISIEDHGIGISKSDMRQIFEPFFRSREVVDAQIHGNGLGLSLVKQIAEAHGGRVYAVSEIGKGSKFTIELPQTGN